MAVLAGLSASVMDEAERSTEPEAERSTGYDPQEGWIGCYNVK